MATPRRRSARLSRKSSTPDRIGARKTLLPQVQLGSLVERDETPERGAQSTLDTILSSPTHPMDPATKLQLDELSTIKTPKTLPRVARSEMNPKEVHQTTARAPDSGLRFGFADIPTSKTAVAAQNTPSKTAPRPSLPQHLTSANFDFKFGSESNLSEEARKLMNNVREDAERIKLHIMAEKDTQARKDSAAEGMFAGVNATGRKIAKAQGRAGRFSDVHMAQFKKMDSIANHPSSFRVKPNFAQPTQQSLKRSGSKAGLDEAERPRTAGKGTPGRQAPPFGQSNPALSPRKPLPSLPVESNRLESNRLENDAPAKRRKSTFGDVSSARTDMKVDENAALKPSILPRPKAGLPASLLTPTKVSVARSNSGKPSLMSPGKFSFLPRSTSVKSLKAPLELTPSSDDASQPSSSPKEIGLVRSERTKSLRPLPPIPSSASALPMKSPNIITSSRPLPAIPSLTLSPSKPSLSSRLPTFQGLKSILRSSRSVVSKTIESPRKEASAGGTPKRSNTLAPCESDSTRKVDFTPSTKSRYAVKLAAASPSPSKLPQGQPTPQRGPLVPYDPAAYTLEDESSEEWEDAESEVEYPILPSSDDNSNNNIPSTPPLAPVTRTFAQKAKDHTRRESKEFKSIFTTLEHPSRSNTPTTLTDVNTKVNVQGAGVIPHYHHNKPSNISRSPSSNTTKPSPSTIRRVRSSGVTNIIQPFEDTIKTIPHGLPGKKRRRESLMEGALPQPLPQQRRKTTFYAVAEEEDEDAGKENRRFPTLRNVPGGWDQGSGFQDDGVSKGVVEVDEGETRGGKRAKTDPQIETGKQMGGGTAEKMVKKPNKAREAAARNAKERKEGMLGGKDRRETMNVGPGGSGAGAGGHGRGILSMARLNMLSRPKERR